MKIGTSDGYFLVKRNNVGLESVMKDGHGYIGILRTESIFPVKAIEEISYTWVISFCEIKERQDDRVKGHKWITIWKKLETGERANSRAERTETDLRFVNTRSRSKFK